MGFIFLVLIVLLVSGQWIGAVIAAVVLALLIVSILP